MTGEVDDGETSLAEDISFLSEDGGEEQEQEQEQEQDDSVEDDSEEVEDTTEEEEEEQKEEEEPKPEEDLIAAKDRAKEITAKYPNIFKEFPDLRKALFQNDQYTTLFPTIESAKEAADKVAHFESLGNDLINGDPGSLLDSVYDVDVSSVSKLALNFLPSLKSRSEELYYKALDPVFRELLTGVRARAVSEKNRGLFAAYQLITEHIYGQKEVKPLQQNQNDPEKIELQRKLAAAQSEKHNAFIDAARNEIDSILAKSIDAKLTSVPANLRDLVREKAIKEIKTQLAKHKNHVDTINRLGEAAKRAGYTSESSKALVDAYTRPARLILGNIVANIVKGLGVKTGQQQQNKVRIPQGTSASGNTNGKIDPRKVDWNKTSDKDFLSDKVVFKK